MRYAVIDNANSLVYSTHEYTGSNWTDFKAQYEHDHDLRKLVDLGSSAFPYGQGWVKDTDGIYPPDGAPKGVADVLPAIQSAIRYKTDQLEYAGTVTFEGELFPRDHDTRDDVVLLALAALTSPAMESSLLPLKVNGISGAEVVISDANDAQTFALAYLSPLKAIYAGQAAQLASVAAMTTITQLIQYIDAR